MDKFLDLLLTRRSIRQYTGAPVAEGDLEKILQAGLLSPSGKNTRLWEFIVIRDRNTLEQLSECRVGAAKMLAGAGCAIVVLGDENKTDTIIEDCSIAMYSMHLMAHSLGLGSCWIQGRLRDAQDGKTTEEYVRELLHIPENYRLEAILSLGIPAKAPKAHTLEELDIAKVHHERF